MNWHVLQNIVKIHKYLLYVKSRDYFVYRTKLGTFIYPTFCHHFLKNYLADVYELILGVNVQFAICILIIHIVWGFAVGLFGHTTSSRHSISILSYYFYFFILLCHTLCDIRYCQVKYSTIYTFLFLSGSNCTVDLFIQV